MPQIQTPIISPLNDPYESSATTLLYYQNAFLRPRTFGSLTDAIQAGRELLLVAEVNGLWSQRVGAGIAKEWVVDPGKRLFQDPTDADMKAADFTRSVIETIDFDAIMTAQYTAVWHGYAVSEIVWGKEGSYYYPAKILPHKQERFRFDRDYQPKLLTTTNMDPGEEIERERLWVTTFNPVAQDPYGRGLAESIYYPVVFLKGGIKSWLLWLEKNAGTVTVEFDDQGANAAERQAKALQLARAYRRDTGIAIPKGMVMKLIETSRTAGDYKDLYTVCKQMIELTILGQLGTSGESGMVRGEISKDVRDEIVKFDSDILHKSFTNDVIRSMIRYNFGDDVAVPTVYRNFRVEKDKNALADLELKLLQLGWRREDNNFIELFGGNLKRDPSLNLSTGIPGLESPGFTEGQRSTTTPERIAAKIYQGIRSLPSQGIELIRDLANRSESLEEFSRKLFDLQDYMDVDGLAEMIAQGNILARLAGQSDVADEVNNGTSSD